MNKPLAVEIIVVAWHGTPEGNGMAYGDRVVYTVSGDDPEAITHLAKVAAGSLTEVGKCVIVRPRFNDCETADGFGFSECRNFGGAWYEVKFTQDAATKARLG